MTTTITISVPEELKRQMDEMPDVNWTEILRRMFIKKLKLLKKFEELERKAERDGD